MNRAKKYSLVLLAGGKSKRMGSDKAQLLYKERTFADNLIKKAEALGITEILLSGFDKTKYCVQTVWDIYPDRGPLGGVHACLKELKTPYALVLPVDVPQIPVELLERLLHAHESGMIEEEKAKLPFLIMHGERRENLMGIYPKTMEAFVEERIRKEAASVHGMLRDHGVIWFAVDVPEWQVENINTQEAYEALLQKEESEYVRENYTGKGSGADL